MCRLLVLDVPVPSEKVQQEVSRLVAGGKTLKAALQAVKGQLTRAAAPTWSGPDLDTAAAEDRAARLSLCWPLRDEEPAEEARKAVWKKRCAQRLAAGARE